MSVSYFRNAQSQNDSSDPDKNIFADKLKDLHITRKDDSVNIPIENPQTLDDKETTNESV